MDFVNKQRYLVNCQIENLPHLNKGDVLVLVDVKNFEDAPKVRLREGVV